MSRTVKQPRWRVCRCERCRAGKTHADTAREEHAKQDIKDAGDAD